MSWLRFLYKKVLKRRDLSFDDLVYPKRPKKLPVVLSPEEVTRLIEATRNPMHRTILMVLYGTGIRRTEASLLKVTDCFSEPVSQRAQEGECSKSVALLIALKRLDRSSHYWIDPRHYPLRSERLMKSG